MKTYFLVLLREFYEQSGSDYNFICKKLFHMKICFFKVIAFSAFLKIAEQDINFYTGAIVTYLGRSGWPDRKDEYRFKRYPKRPIWT